MPRTFITRLFKPDDAGTGETPGSAISDTAKETKAPASGIANTANFVSAQTVKDTTVKDTDTKKTAQVPSSARGVTPEFKAAMDSYETFFNEYVAFIKKFENDSSNLAMLGDYAAFMTRYADMIQKIDAIEERQLSAADDAYYLEATVRIYKKLAEISM